MTKIKTQTEALTEEQIYDELLETNLYESEQNFDAFCDMIEEEHKVNKTVNRLSNPNRDIMFTYLQGL